MSMEQARPAADRSRMHNGTSVPKGWLATPLGNVATFQRGFDLPTRQRCNGSVPVVSSAGITDHHNASMVASPGVVTGRYGTIGELFYVATPFWPLNTTLFVRDFHGNDPRFVYYALQRFDFKTFSGKSGVPGVNRNELHRESITVPRGVSEQRAIADALGDVDALLDALDQLVDKQRALKQAAMQQLLTGRTRLPGFTGESMVLGVAELERRGFLKLGRGQVISRKNIDARPGNYPIYSSSIHNDGVFGRYGDFMFDEELVTWSIDGGGDFFYRAKHRFSVTNVCGFVRVDTSRIDYRYLAAELQVLHGRKNFDYQSKAHPSVVRKEYELRLPPLAEQTAIAAVLSDMDAEVAALEARRAKTCDLKQAMMQELLTGKTRLV